jgi:hypothetical protein
VIVSLALSGGVGYGIYRVAKAHRLEREAAEAALPKPPPPMRDEPVAPRAARPIDPIDPPEPVDPIDTTEVAPSPIAKPPPNDYRDDLEMIGHVDVDGSYDRGTLQRALEGRQSSLAKCNDPSHGTGAIDVTVVIETSGMATGVQATGFDRGVASCVAGVIRRTRFTGGTERVSAKFPVRYR